MTFTENHYDHISPDEIFSVAERENNSKRKNLIVNKMQGKHFPVKASESLRLFYALSDRIKVSNAENTMIIGFAETATAIGAAAAEKLGAKRFIHTTREFFPENLKIVSFSEEHSHASNQELYSRSSREIFDGITDIVFIDDELTTGKTILNFIEKLRNIVPRCHFCAASLINGMSEENLGKFSEYGIDTAYLFKTDNSLDFLQKDLSVPRSPDLSAGKEKNYREINAGKIIDPRLSADTKEYVLSCKNAVSRILPYLTEFDKIDVIGTEEFMYPSLLLCEALEKKGKDARTHSTTRSPIVPSVSENYPLFSRCSLHSFYERERQTYLYNIYPADAAVIFTDTKEFSEKTASEFTSFMKTDNIFFARSESI